MVSTDEVMARDGRWLALDEGMRLLEGLLHHIQSKQIRFGLLKNQHAGVEELQAVMAFARSGSARAQKFNFSIVS